MSDSMRVAVVVEAIDHLTAPLSRMSQALGRVLDPVRRVHGAIAGLGNAAGVGRVTAAADHLGASVARVGREAGALGMRLAALGGGAGWLFKSELIDTASQFERFQTILETTEGSAAGARKAMDWVSDFAARTPYGLDEVTASFVKLRAYGLDPTHGLLRTLGDTAAAMGKPVEAAVEAIADAVTGENERLKEFGITAQSKGNKIRYSYTDKEGKQSFKTVNASDRKAIEQTISAIWNEKYGGAMEKLSKTWDGMLSNLGDQWDRFKLKIMEAGAFDWLKGKLSGLLETIDRMAASGELQTMAADWGGRLVRGLEQAWEAGKALGKVLEQLFDAASWVAEKVGGWERVGMGLAAVMGVSLVGAVASAGVALINFGVVLATTPVGWFLAAVAAVAVGAYLIYTHWADIDRWFTAKLGRVKDAFAGGWLRGIATAIKEFNGFTLLWDYYDGMAQTLFGVDLKGPAGRWLDGLVQGITASGERVLASLRRLMDRIGDIFSRGSLWEVGGRLLASLLAGLSSGAGALFAWVSDTLAGWAASWTGDTLVDRGNRMVLGFLSGVAGAWGAVMTWTAEAFAILGSAFDGSPWADVGTALVDHLKAGIEQAWSALPAWLHEKLDALLSLVPESLRGAIGLDTPLQGPDLPAGRVAPPAPRLADPLKLPEVAETVVRRVPIVDAASTIPALAARPPAPRLASREQSLPSLARRQETPPPQEVGGTIRVEFLGVPEGTKVRDVAAHGGIDLETEVSRGYSMVGVR